MKMKSPLLALLLLMLSPCAMADTPEQLLKQFVDGVQSFSGRFEQVQRDEFGELIAQSQGEMALQRPGRFRWAYETPYVQLIVSDGEKVYHYDPDLKQVNVRPSAQALEGTPAALLLQGGDLSTAYALSDGGVDGAARRLRLTPRVAETDFTAIELWLLDGIPQRMRFHDPLGGISDVHFSKVRTNQQMDAALFRFQVPAGVDVVE